MKRTLAAIAVLLGMLWAVPAFATCTLPYQLQNGKISDSNQVMANFNSVISCIVAQGPGGTSPQVQYNNAGAFGGLTDVALTARIQPFTTLLNGAVPAPITTNGYFLKDNGTWAATTGAFCTGTAFAVQYNNSGTGGCAPMIVNSGVMDFTPSGSPVWQIGGTAFLTHPLSCCFGMGFGALASVTSNNGPIFCIGNSACGSVTSDAGDYFALGDQSCGDGASASGGSALVCVGYGAGHTTSGGNSSDTYVGSQAAYYMNGGNNVAVGDLACEGASGGSNGSNNLCLGHHAALGITTGNNNVIAGYDSGGGITSGTFDICLGSLSCPNLTTGSSDIFILAGNGSSGCLLSSASVSNEFDLCGTGADTSPIERCVLTSLAAGNCVFNVPLSTGGYTVSTLPASPPKGSRAYVTDATACTFGSAPTGGASTFCPEIFDGSAWHGG